MATDTENKQKSIINLADEIRKNKKVRDTDSGKESLDDLKDLVETIRKQKAENTVTRKLLDNVAKKIDKASNPTTYLKAIVPKFFKTFHENLEKYDVERAALKKIDAIETAARKKEISDLTKNLSDLIAKDSKLADIQKQFGEKAAQMAALGREEMKKVAQAEEQYLKNMAEIDKRLSNISDDARQEWAKSKGIQLVKIVDDKPTEEALNEIKAKLSEQIEADADKFYTEKLEANKKATEERRYKESMLKQQGLFAKLFSKKEAKADAKKGDGSFLSSLVGGLGGLASSLVPLLIKAGVITAIIAGINEYMTNPEFKEKVDKMTGDLFELIKGFMIKHWDKVLLGLALLFPEQTLKIIGAGLQLLANLLDPKVVTGVISLLRGLIGVLSGPAGVIALLALLAYGLYEWWKKNTDMGREYVKNREFQEKIKDPQKDVPAPQNVPLNPAKANKPITQDTKLTMEDPAFAEEVERRAQKKVWDKFGANMIYRNADGTYTDTYLRILAVYRRDAEEELKYELQAKALKAQKDLEKNKPAPAAPAVPPPPAVAPAGDQKTSMGGPSVINAPSVAHNNVNNTTVVSQVSAIDSRRLLQFTNFERA